MANRVRGEKAVKFQGKEITLKLTMNAMCQLEDKTGKSIGVILSEIEVWGDDPSKIKMSDVRHLFWALMLDAMPEATAEDAGSLIDEFDGNYLTFIGEAISTAFPSANEEQTGK